MTGSPRFQSSDIFKQERDPLTEQQVLRETRAAAPAQRNVAVQEDPLGTSSLYSTALQDTVFFMGQVVCALPHLHHYKLQLSGGAMVEAALMGLSSNVGIGARQSDLITPGSAVCVYKPPGFSMYVILGCVPGLCTNDKFNSAQILQLGSNTIARSQEGYKQILKLKDNGRINSFGSGRPLDGNVFEHSIVTETGISFLLDAYQAALSVNESCGLFLNWWDSYTKLTGQQIDIQSYADHIMQRYDEGENLYIRGGIIYPWEATGNYKHGIDFTTQNSPSDYQTKKDKPYGYYDLPAGEEDLAPIYRYMEYGGYLGQGYTRMLMKPAKEDGKRQFSKSDDPDYGLWQESIALDGSYTMRSAKSVYIGKYILIPIPKREKMPEDQKDGDDARKGNYKFSNEFGGGDPHKVKDIKVEGKGPHLLRVSGVLDLLAYNYNWKNTHPFYYHKKDYKFWDESELEDLEKAQSQLDYDSPKEFGYLKEPNKETLKIDNRYNEVNYYQSMSYLTFLEDGGVALGDGYGSQITMTGGKIRLEAPNDIMIMPGARAITYCDEMFVRARNNIEFSSTDKDVRFKSENNMQFVSGNSGSGGMLFESKSTSSSHIYKGLTGGKGLYGDQVIGSGIVFLAKKSDVGVLAKNVYIRSGAAEQKGNITLDGAQGEKDIVCYSKAMNIFNSQGLNIWHSPQGQEGGAFNASHRFGKEVCVISGHCIVEKWICNYDGGLISKKSVVSAGNVVAVKKMAQRGGGPLGKSDMVANDIANTLTACQVAAKKHLSFGEPLWNGVIKAKYYETPTLLGNKELITDNMGFSFNDRPSGPGYNLQATWGLIESRWQQYVRLNIASGGTAWTEKSVKYQNNELYPYPGKKLWKEGQKFQQLEKLNMFDTTKKYSKDRPTDYEEPELAEFIAKKADGTYKLIDSSY